MQTSSETGSPTQNKKGGVSRHVAVASSLGYNTLGAALWSYPGIAPKAIGVGLALKGTSDFLHAYETDLPIALEPRKRMRQRFTEFMTSWKDNNQEGATLSQRFKRRTAEEVLSFQDKEFRLRFNRMMGGMMLAGTGIEIAASYYHQRTGTWWSTYGSWNSRKFI